MPLRVVFFGSPPFAAAVLEALHDALDVVLVVTQPDRPSGRNRRPSPTAVKAFAGSKGLEVTEPGQPGLGESLDQLILSRPDVIVTVAYGLILPPQVLVVPAMGCVNVHPSLLPRQRGASPIPGAILAGDALTGVTTMLMDSGMDTGPILLQEDFPLGNLSAREVFDELAAQASSLTLRTLHGLASGRVRPRPQDHDSATYTRTLKKEDGLMDWTTDSGALARFVRAMDPWPGAFSALDGEFIKIWKAAPLEGKGSPGVVKDVTKQGIVVGAGSGLLLVEEVQSPSKKRVHASDFARGRRLVPGVGFALPERERSYESFLRSFTSEPRHTFLKTQGGSQ